MISYKLTKTINSTEFCSYTSYGICAVDTADNKIVLNIDDIFLNEQDAVNFVKKCNRLGLSPIHLRDVIEDVL